MEQIIRDFLRDRSEGNFLRIYSQYNTSLYRIALSGLNFDRFDAEDVLQETWLVAVKEVTKFKGESAFRTWITSILINKCREKHRERSRYAGEEFRTPVLNTFTDTQILSMDIENAISTLPPGYAQVLVLHDAEGYTHAEIGELLGISPGTSKSQLHHARNMIRKYLNAHIK